VGIAARAMVGAAYGGAAFATSVGDDIRSAERRRARLVLLPFRPTVRSRGSGRAGTRTRLGNGLPRILLEEGKRMKA